MWTHFWDMHSGGGQKLDWGHILIEAPEAQARLIFKRRFGRDPDNVTCDCCGADYSVSEYETLGDAVRYQENSYRKPLGVLEQEKIVLVIRAKQPTKPTPALQTKFVRSGSYVRGRV